MPNLQTSIKDLRQTKKRTVYNDRLRNRVKRATKRFEDLLKEEKFNEAEKALEQVYKVLDKTAKKNVIKKGNASRKKSRLASKLNKLAQDNVDTSKKGS
ncbi:MAG: 30S ribosomal protein S20 [Candidatus Dojkabacteria bacterium]|jgi:small subunit ribosomal protein S20|nr:30S ribosomal protein S20 [Candidatus Dojkabacteria bacterium]MDD2270174.1 30S ribosomal protein S20 [Candidatus Dojkabacteria bacterium]